MTWTWIEKYWQTFSRSAVNGVMASFLMTYIRSDCREKAINHGGNVRMGTVAAAFRRELMPSGCRIDGTEKV